jgi:flagellar biosynthesis protein FlhF
MKIKRFEASTMSEALRMIKKEFGEDAVILSAKTQKKSSGLLGGKRPQKVVVTAAIDQSVPGASDVSAQEEHCKDASAYSSASAGTGRAFSKFSFLKNYQPITRTGQEKVKPKIVQIMTTTAAVPKRRELEQQLLDQGLSPNCSAELTEQIEAILGPENDTAKAKARALAQALDAMQIVGMVNPGGSSKPRVVVMAGPAGVGKTSAVVKLAAKHIMEHREAVGIISLDNQRVAAAAELERYAAIMDVKLIRAHNTRQIAQAVQSFESMDLIVVDTPGMALDDHGPLQELKASLSDIDHLDVYLLMSATAQEKVMARTISFFKPLNAARLMFTKLDWAMDIGPMINQAIASGKPIAYLCDSPKIPEGIRTATAAELSALLLPASSMPLMDREPDALTLQQRILAQETASYVANRNSDIFHHNSCKSVKRIHADNMMMFKDPAEALGRQFKPCRMCCSDLMVTKPIERQANRAAGNRC